MKIVRTKITLDKPQTAIVKVFFETVGGTALADVDYTSLDSFLVFLPGETEKLLSVGVRDPSPNAFPEGRTLTIRLTSVTGVEGLKIGTRNEFTVTVATQEILPVPFPGRRLAIVGDSISWYNTAYVPPKSWSGRYENWGAGMGGWWTNADQILEGRLSLEPVLEQNMQGKQHGNNFALAGTQVKNWWNQQDIPLPDTGTVEIGPMFAALANLDKFDVVAMMGGTNDLANNTTGPEIIDLLKEAVMEFTSRGKWVFLLGLPARSRDYLRGYTIQQQDVIRNRLKEVNAGIVQWIAEEDPANVWYVDCFTPTVGPNGNDPCGFVSNDTDPNADSTRGNYNPNEPGVVYMHDGLHPGPAGGRAMGKALAEVMIAAGIPALPNPDDIGIYQTGPNLLPNPQMTFTAYPLAISPPSFAWSSIGMATGQGPLITTGDVNGGYEHGRIPDCWNLFSASNEENLTIGRGTGGTYSNFMKYTWSDFTNEFPKLNEYIRDATYAPGAITTSIVTHEGTPAFKIDINFPQSDNKCQMFNVGSSFPRDQHGPWDNWGWDSPDAGEPRPNTLYGAGDVLTGSVDLVISGGMSSMVACQAVLYSFGIVPQAEFGAQRMSFANHQFFWPPSDYDEIRFSSEERRVHLHMPAIIVPQYTEAQTIRYGDLKLEFGFDCTKGPVVGSIIIKNPSVRKVLNPGV